MSELLNLENLEFEDLEMSRGKDSEVDDSKIKTEEKILIDYSSNIIIALQEIMKSHNKECKDNKVSLKELKQVFRRGADCKEAKESKLSCGTLALARVNMFLRLKSGEIMEASRSHINNKSMDISDCWIPNEQDITKASKDVEKHNLDYDFKNINNLYLEEYMKIELEY